MKTGFALCAIVAIVRTASVDLNKRASPLAVTLTHLNDTAFKVGITNSGLNGYNLLYAGSLLDDAPTDDLIITSATSPAKFHGVHLRPLQSHLTQAAFVSIAAGQTISKQIDIAEIYETPSDSYTVTAAGSFPYAEADSTELSGKSLSFTSNTVKMDIDGDIAAKVIYKVDRMHSKRTDLESDCSSTQLSTVKAALSNCEKLASAAADAAANGHGTIFAEYFKTESLRPDVATRLRDVAKDCAATTSGATTTSCKDQYSACSDNVLAYTIPQKNAVFLCSSFFSYLPAVADSCHAQDQATTVIHENTHAPAVDNPGTSDNGYGYSA
ncbi:hypothetical protein LTR78_004593 [Recurvomyces mirabilis]|uniref:Neutral protease 2 n=1 Tax=Recurvomyces mirabilis TaxID=574656 RepID=A0AAE0WPC5_9PEZI|nr:hypothetical protein LTR78_004593 [Recurvomyces mirabilis]KAK5152913.1 hypothetical protein LTS14_008021 [Recurvomyces mirabilis]